MLELIRPNLYRITVPLPGSPLKSLNSYVVLGKTRNLLIDNGFNWDVCYQDLMRGVNELGLDMRQTDLFITHFHADHCGLTARIVAPGAAVYMSRIDKEMFDESMFGKAGPWRGMEDALQCEGYPAEALRETHKVNPARIYASDKPFDAVLLEDGMELWVDNNCFKVIATPGHTPGHVCLYWPSEKILFTGDHILFDITPNIQNWLNMEDVLGSYLHSLDKVRRLDTKLVLTGHRENSGTLACRVDELRLHHEARLAEILQILAETPGLTGYEVAGRMRWSIRARNWAEFPPVQRWFAVGETVAHLQHLVHTKRLHKSLQGGLWRYTAG